MDEDGANAFLEMVLRTADPSYLAPPPEFLGKFMVCKDFKVLQVFDTEEEAKEEASRYPAGSIEIRQPLPSDDGSRTRVIIPGAVSRSSEP